MKNSIIIFVGIFICSFARADVPDVLDAQISELTARRDALKQEIESCQKSTKNYKIAGISTLAVTGVGVVGNVILNNKINENGNGFMDRSGGVKTDTLPQEEKDRSSCQQFAELGIELPPECQ